MVILHGSDLQTGRPYRPGPAAAFVALAHELSPDLVVVAGDLTQRAKVGEFRRARALLDELAPLPVVTTPGNHDVPLYRFWERLATPYANWRRFVAASLDSVTRVDGATVVALNSSAPRRAIVAGRLTRAQLDFARRSFGAAPRGDLRIVVTHHHFVRPADGQGGRPLPGAADLLRAFEDMGVELILGGHVHQTHLGTSRALVEGPGPGIPLVACGTTTSSRGRGPEQGLNSLNVVRIGERSVIVESRRYREGRGFERASERELERPRAGAPGARA